MTRMEDMIKRYGECVTIAAAARIMGRSRYTVKRMIDGRVHRITGAGRSQGAGGEEQQLRVKPLQRMTKKPRTGGAAWVARGAALA